MAFDSATSIAKFATIIYSKQSKVHPGKVFSALRKPCNSAVFLISFLIYLVGIFPSIVFALPTDPAIQSGSVNIEITTHEPDADILKTMNVYQGTDKAIIDWGSFNIDTLEHVAFQLSQGGVTLNRVTGNDPSQILGKLTSL